MPDSRTGTAIKRARERKRWTQRRLADELGVNVKTVDNWEAGRTSPRNRLGALEEVLGISLDGEPPAPGPLADLEPLDEWESEVAADRYLDGETKRWLVTESRAARAEYARVRRERRAAQAADQSPGRGRTAG